MNTFNSLRAFGQPAVKAKLIRRIDPLQRMQKSFVAKVRQQVELLQSDNPCGNHDSRSWFRRYEDATGGEIFITSLRNGTKTIPLGDGTTHLEVSTKTRLQEFFQAAIRACESGELDQALLETRRKPQKVEAAPIDGGA